MITSSFKIRYMKSNENFIAQRSKEKSYFKIYQTMKWNENTLFKQGNPLSVKYTVILRGPDKFTNTVNNYMI